VILDGGVGKIVALTKIGTGTQTLVGDSTYSGVTTISVGTLAITHGNALGSTAGNTTIAALGNTNGGILSLSNNITSAENITITGATEQNSYMSAILNTGGNNILSGNIILNGSGGIRLGTTGGTLRFSGTISQSVTSHGLAFSASNAITVDNAIALNGGTLQVYSAGSVTLKGVNGVGGIGNTVISQSGTLKLGVSEALNTTGNLDIGVGTALTTDAGTFDLAGFDQTVNVLSGIGTAATNSSRKVINSVAGTKTLTLGNGGGTGTFNGVILTGTGQVALTKTGSGTQTLAGTNTYTGATSVTGGTLKLGASGSIANSSSINVATGATFDVSAVTGGWTLGASQSVGGTGTLLNTGSTITASGTLAPGNSPGTLTVDGGTLALVNGGDYSFQIIDAAGLPGTGYDTVSLTNGATLNLAALTAGGYTINLLSLTSIGPDVSGNANFFNNTQNYSWTLFSTGSAIANFDIGDFTINSAGFTNALGGGGFSVGLADGNTDLVLNFTAIPEPTSALLGCLGVLLILRRRR